MDTGNSRCLPDVVLMLGQRCRRWPDIKPMLDQLGKSYRPLGYERVYLLLYKVAGTPFQIQGDDVI